MNEYWIASISIIVCGFLIGSCVNSCEQGEVRKHEWSMRSAQYKQELERLKIERNCNEQK